MMVYDAFEKSIIWDKRKIINELTSFMMLLQKNCFFKKKSDMTQTGERQEKKDYRKRRATARTINQR